MDVNAYIENRLKEQQQLFHEKAESNKRRFMDFHSLIIVLGALIPLVIVIESWSSIKGWANPVTAAFSATISILAGLDKLKQPHANWFNFRLIAEQLKKEEWLYKFAAGPYHRISPKDGEKILVERVENIVATETSRFTQLNRSHSIETSLDITSVTVQEESTPTVE